MSEYVHRHRFAVPIDAAAVAEDWRARGFSCATFVDPPGRRWEDFVHDCNELVTVVEGRLEMEVAGQSAIVEPGDEVFIPKGARHSVRNIHDGQSVWLYGYD
ncbi:MAG: cupin domain-containing protein [Alphaproteobacteria bacterium]|nr:MAG: cupin domain-containing protein [Alphaproteobacteria bacterium]